MVTVDYYGEVTFVNVGKATVTASVAEGKGKNIDEFTDKGEINEWATDGLKWALSHGIMVGKEGGKLDPKGIAKRSECAAVVTHFMENFEE